MGGMPPAMPGIPAIGGIPPINPFFPILPIFFMVQFNFLYEGWRNEFAFDVKAGLLIGGLGLFLLAVGAGAVGDAAVLLPFGLESIFGVEALAGLSETISGFLGGAEGML